MLRLRSRRPSHGWLVLAHWLASCRPAVLRELVQLPSWAVTDTIGQGQNMHRQLLMLLGFLAAAAIVARGQVSSITNEKALALGRSLGEDLERRDGRFAGPGVSSYVQEAADRLALAAGGKAPEIRLTRSSELYAHLLPHGVLYISKGLFARLESEAELAGLLAHQLAHMHGPLQVAQPRASITIPMPVCVLASPVFPSGRREAEQLATREAIRTLRLAGYDPLAVLDVFLKLAHETPLWAMAVVPQERDDPPEAGYRTDSSEFKNQRATVTGEAKDASVYRPAPSLRWPGAR